MKRFKISWEALKKHSKKYDPYTRVHMMAAKKVGGIPEGQYINVSAVKVTMKDNEKLVDIAIDWAVKTGKCFSKEQAKRSVAWLSLDIGPGLTQTGEPGYAYIDVENLFRKKESP